MYIQLIGLFYYLRSTGKCTKKCYSVTKLKSFGPNFNELSEIMIDNRMSSTASQSTLNKF